MLKPRPESPLSNVISSVIHSGFALPFIWASRLNSDDTFLIIPFEELNGFFLVEPDRLSSFMTFLARTFVCTQQSHLLQYMAIRRTPYTPGRLVVPSSKLANFANCQYYWRRRRPPQPRELMPTSDYFWKSVSYIPIYIYTTVTAAYLSTVIGRETVRDDVATHTRRPPFIATLLLRSSPSRQYWLVSVGIRRAVACRAFSLLAT